jgi:hypothetical protein
MLNLVFERVVLPLPLVGTPCPDPCAEPILAAELSVLTGGQPRESPSATQFKSNFTLRAGIYRSLGNGETPQRNSRLAA